MQNDCAVFESEIKNPAQMGPGSKAKQKKGMGKYRYNSIPVHADKQQEVSEYSNIVYISSQNELMGTGIRQLDNGLFQAIRFERKTGNPMYWFGAFDVKSQWFKLLVTEYYWRFLYPLLSIPQTLVMMFLVDRIFCWGKEKERIRKKHFLSGIDNASGGCLLKSRSHIDKTIKELIDLGFVTKQTDSFGDWYEINVNTIQQWVVSNNGGIKMRESKNPDNAIKREFSKRTPQVQQSDNCTPQVQPYKESKIPQKQTIDKGATRDNADKILQRIKTNVQKKFEGSNKNKKIENFKTGSNTSIRFIENWWKQETLNLYPDCVSVDWTGKVCGQVKNFFKSVTMPEGKTHADFLGFVLGRWVTIKGQHFDYMNTKRLEEGKQAIQMPEYPDMGFVMSFKQIFLNAYQRELNQDLRGDRRDIRRMRDYGYTDDEISEVLLEKAASKESIAQEKKRLDKEKEALRREKMQLRADQDRLMSERLRFGSQVIENRVKHNIVNTDKPIIEKPSEKKNKDTLSTQTKKENRHGLSDESMQLAEAWAVDLAKTKPWIDTELIESHIALYGVEETRHLLFDVDA